MDTDTVKKLFDYRDGNLWWREQPHSVDMNKPAGSDIGNYGYRRIIMNRKHYLAHRLVWLWHGRELPKHIDHINGDPLDNRIENLREATIQQNGCNRGKNKNNSSGYKGVTWHKANKKWLAQIMHNGKNIYLGCFDLLEDAAEAYQAKAKELHGEYYHDAQLALRRRNLSQGYK